MSRRIRLARRIFHHYREDGQPAVRAAWRAWRDARTWPKGKAEHAMTPETAAILSRAVRIRDSAAGALAELSRGDDSDDRDELRTERTKRTRREESTTPPTPSDDVKCALRARIAEVYVHEQRIINRIVSGD